MKLAQAAVARIRWLFHGEPHWPSMRDELDNPQRTYWGNSKRACVGKCCDGDPDAPYPGMCSSFHCAFARIPEEHREPLWNSVDLAQFQREEDQRTAAMDAAARERTAAAHARAVAAEQEQERERRLAEPLRAHRLERERQRRLAEFQARLDRELETAP